MTELPLHCICGYQEHINRLEAQLEVTERKLKQWQALCDTYYAKLVFEPHNTYHFITGYRYLAAGGK